MKRIFLILLGSLVVGITGYSQEKAQMEYSISGGVLGALNFAEFRIADANPTNVDYNTKTGWSAGAWVNFPVGTTFSIEPQLMYSSYRYLANSTTTPLLLRDGKISYISLPLLLKIHPFDKLAISVGPQFDFVSSVKDNDNVAVAEDFNKTSISVFGGLEVFPHSRVSIFGRYIHGLSNMDADENHVSGLDYKNQNIQVGLKLRLFGGIKEPAAPVIVEIPDSDGDGINDQLDKCPNTPGLAKYDGCPIPDTDGDGINDELDKCPTVKGLAKYDGCPIPDTDGDGINDELDKCPTVAGPADRNGCPIPDTDADGINDDNDKCPDIAGTAANQGCPDVPANLTKSLQSAAGKISFGSNNATLTTSGKTSLNQVVILMNENPAMKLMIEAHTDNVGDDDRNEELSENRADAVKAYLVSKGIAEDRIETEGYGESMPIADNNTAAGRAKNRRIELKMMY